MAGIYYPPDPEITLNLAYEDVRALLLETLKGSSQGSIDSSHSHIAKLVVDKEIVPDPYNQPGTEHLNKQYKLSNKYQQIIRDIFWDLVIEGVVRPGINEHQQGFPWYHITEKGKTVIESGGTQS